MVQFLELSHSSCLTPQDLGMFPCQCLDLKEGGKENKHSNETHIKDIVLVWYSVKKQKKQDWTGLTHVNKEHVLTKAELWDIFYLQISESAHWDPIQLIYPGQNHMPPLNSTVEVGSRCLKQFHCIINNLFVYLICISYL